MKFSVITPTNNPEHLGDAYKSLKAQSYSNWEWVVFCNSQTGIRRNTQDIAATVRGIVGDDNRVRVIECTLSTDGGGVGPLKKAAFAKGTGDVLVELDHDDVLLPDCLDRLQLAFLDPEVGFVYSDWADFEGDISKGEQGTPTYRSKETREAWLRNGFKFYDAWLKLPSGDSFDLECVKSFEPSAVALSLIFWAPNHVRAWRRTVYEAIGGHSEKYPVCDDHELMIRTYLATKMVSTRKPLYLYRVHGRNTFSDRLDLIEKLTRELCAKWIHELVVRECKLRERLCVELHKPGTLDAKTLATPMPERAPRGDWIPVCISELPLLRIAFSRHDIGAIRAFDALQHYPDKKEAMEAIHSALTLGGHFIATTPSTDGRGAFMDPRHKSYWNPNSFWYWTRPEFHKVLYGPRSWAYRFQEIENLNTHFSHWWEQNKIPFVLTHLVVVNAGYTGPGEVLYPL